MYSGKSSFEKGENDRVNDIFAIPYALSQYVTQLTFKPWMDSKALPILESIKSSDNSFLLRLLLHALFNFLLTIFWQFYIRVWSPRCYLQLDACLAQCFSNTLTYLCILRCASESVMFTLASTLNALPNCHLSPDISSVLLKFYDV